jgi:hypothetical protein
MNAVNRLTSLLRVQKGRVDRAIAQVHEQNRILREWESERDAARQRWADAVGACLSCDAYRIQMTAAAEQLRVAEDSVSSALAAAMEARTAYRRSLARQEALTTLQASWRKREWLRHVDSE